MLKNFFGQGIYIIDAVRTPIGGVNKSFKNLSASQLAAVTIKELIHRTRVNKYSINQVILGNTVAAGLGQNFARQAALLADLDETIPAFSVNNVCGSGLQAVILGAQAILAGDADLIIAGASESATQTPFLVDKDESSSPKSREKIDSLVSDGLFCKMTGKSMGEIVEGLVKKYGISKEEQDFYAYESHRKAVLAQQQNKFSKEIIPVKVSASKTIDKDERPRANLKLDALKGLRPAFKADGTVTAGNSSVPSDGAAAVLLASRPFIQKQKIRPLAKLTGYASIALKPELTFESAMEVIKAILKKNNLKLEQIDLFEIAESFAAQIVVTKNKLGILDNKLNIFGGDIALGHPLGSAGTRILVTLVHALHDQKWRRGLAAISYGGGGGIALLVKRI